MCKDLCVYHFMVSMILYVSCLPLNIAFTFIFFLYCYSLYFCGKSSIYVKSVAFCIHDTVCDIWSTDTSHSLLHFIHRSPFSIFMSCSFPFVLLQVFVNKMEIHFFFPFVYFPIGIWRTGIGFFCNLMKFNKNNVDLI